MPLHSRHVRALGALGALVVVIAAPRAGAQQRAVLRGVVYDSLARAPLAGALVQAAPAGDLVRVRTVYADSLGAFRFDTVSAGRWVLGFDHPVVGMLSLDMPTRAVDVAAGDTTAVVLSLPGGRRMHRVLCGEATGDSTGALVGMVRDADRDAPVDSVRAFVAWPELEIGRGRIAQVTRRVPLPVRVDGSFVLCGVPSDAELMVRAEGRGVASGDVMVEVKPGTVTRQDLSVGAPRATASRLTGTVRDDKGHPIGHARVIVLGIEGRGATTSETGAFVLDSLPSGTWTMEARAIGRRPTRAVAQLSTRRVADVQFAMPKYAQSLDRVVVVGKMSVATRELTEALERTRMHGGTLITPDQIERRNPLYPSDLLRTVPGMQVLPGQFGNVIRGRGRCTPTVYLDGMPIQDGANDIDQLVPAADVMAVEVYRGIVAPVEYAGGGCGTVLLWTKR
ncbi:TonB-dependent receptor plug [Gemmatirosa kalamazoonensis]|uniref:TonB-dependent receptor plug n=1 Tax=Gemmatirosa kalamazoonensis TaxID=861299 RepID=W0RLZ4_9BACT|nr:carboxypeptidase regulatory-like domain-containing protein [Gemmatirosa kalamazoonensis]AHG91766.1 TonB-dependent receptor plug [Gemmatirosa kalamazoonensis]